MFASPGASFIAISACLRASARSPLFANSHAIRYLTVALAVRMGGLLLFGIAVALLAAKAVARLRTEFRIAIRNARCLFTTTDGPALKLLAAACVAWGVMVAAWPWAHRNPLLNPLIALRENLNFQLFKEVLYGGKVVYSTVDVAESVVHLAPNPLTVR